MQGGDLLWSSGAHTDSFIHTNKCADVLASHTTELVSMPLVKLNETNSYKAPKKDQSATMRKGLKTL